MVRVVIYGERSEETEGLEVMLRTILTEKQQWPVIHTCYEVTFVKRIF